jgi:hypothetical protein
VEIDAGATGETAPVVGSLEIVSQPAGATVFLDGVERGKTPVVVAEVAEGIHEIRLVKDGFVDSSMKKAVRAGRDETVSAMLAAAPAKPATTTGGSTPIKGGRPGHGTKPNSGKPDTGHTDSGHTDTGHTDTGHTDTGHSQTGGPRNPYGDDDPPHNSGTGTGTGKKNPYDD